MIKAYHERGSDKTVLVVNEIRNEDNNIQDDVEFKKTAYDLRLYNSESLANLDTKLSHLLSDRRQEISGDICIIKAYFMMYPDKRPPPIMMLMSMAHHLLNSMHVG